jgi:hypothetical protein
LLIERRLAGLVGHRLARLCELAAQLEDYSLAFLRAPRSAPATRAGMPCNFVNTTPAMASIIALTACPPSY